MTSWNITLAGDTNRIDSFMVGFFHVSSFLIGVLVFFCLVELQVLPSLYSGVIKLGDIGGTFINANIWANFEFFSLQNAWFGLVSYNDPCFLVLFQKETRRKNTGFNHHRVHPKPHIKRRVKECVEVLHGNLNDIHTGNTHSNLNGHFAVLDVIHLKTKENVCYKFLSSLIMGGRFFVGNAVGFFQ